MIGATVTIVAPAKEPIDLEAVKRFLRIDGSAQDDDVSLLIQAARSDLERITGQRLLDQVVRVQADSFDDLDHLPVGPVKSIKAVTYGAPGAPTAIDPANLYLTGLGLERGIAAVPGYRLPRTVAGPILVDLNVGYGSDPSAVPANLRLVLFVLIRSRFDDRPVDVEPLLVNDRIY
ncbi:head-tail connector protein [Sphingomonas sp. Leaf257]|jgi:hypothetical protein|uniref:head-tail connector protein n=1 Tax=Sphingomonas sp. Leaf257 TaxID=1736309 RepID=UPI0006FD22E3|nr:phage head-tail connector protein [Sphingomonas sp. Leaf257]KQO51404.1 hypothetical protein ASF14_07860 [Sphingomonas sp. Leaf257]